MRELVLLVVRAFAAMLAMEVAVANLAATMALEMLAPITLALALAAG